MHSNPKLFKVIHDMIQQLGFELVDITLQNQPKTKAIEILIDRQDGQAITIADCGTVSKNIAVLLNVESDLTPGQLHLTVSSAGVERPLVKLEDYNRFVGKNVKIKLHKNLNKRSRYYGIIKAVNCTIIHILTEKNEMIEIPFEMIKNANLVLTDEMFKKILNKC